MESKKFKILDLFAGTGSMTKAWEDAGHEVIKVEIWDRFEANERDIMKLTAEYLTEKYGKFDYIHASPPCTTFSIASGDYYYTLVDGVITPRADKLDAIQHGKDLVLKTIDLITKLEPVYGYTIENPRGRLRKEPFMQSMNRQTISYCQYGDFRMKPTDIWSNIKDWKARPICKPKANCHEAAPRGSHKGNQRLGKTSRSVIPYELGKEIMLHITDLANKI